MITLATLPQATAQEVFDQVKNHLLTQKARALNEEGMCVYRGINGTKCAAGCLIADSEYTERMDSKSEDNAWENYIDEGIVPGNHAYLIKALQDIHDKRDPESWDYELEKLAENYNLNYEI